MIVLGKSMIQESSLHQANDEPDSTRNGAKHPLYREMGGIVTATHASFVKEGKRLGKKVGLIPLRSLSARVDTRDEVGLFLARHLTLTAALR